MTKSRVSGQRVPNQNDPRLGIRDLSGANAAKIEKFENIEAWRKVRELAKKNDAVSNERPFARDFGLSDQIRRAIVKGSAGEVKAQLYVAANILSSEV